MNKLAHLIALTLVATVNVNAAANDNIDDTENNSQSTFKLGVNAIKNAQGYKNYDDGLKVLPSAFYESDNYYVRGNQLGVNLLKNSTHEASVFAQYTGNSFAPDNAENQFKNLNERKPSAFAGISYLYVSPIGGFRMQYAKDVMGTSDGSIGKLSYIGRFTKDKLTLTPSVGIKWLDENYNNYYYGVSEKESNNTVIEKYTAKSSTNPYASVMATYDINQDWGLFFNQNITLLDDTQKDSPMVDSDIASSTTLGVLYSF